MSYTVTDSGQATQTVIERDLRPTPVGATRQRPKGVCGLGGQRLFRPDHDCDRAVTESVLELERRCAALVASGLAVAVDDGRVTALITLDVGDLEAVERLTDVVVRGV